MAGMMHDERIDRLFWNARYLRFRAPPKRIKKRVVRLRFNGELVGCDPFLTPGFSVPRAGYLVFRLLSTGFLTGVLFTGALMVDGIFWDAGERLRGVVCPSCGRRVGNTSGDGFGGCISRILGRCFNGHLRNDGLF